MKNRAYTVAIISFSGRPIRIFSVSVGSLILASTLIVIIAVSLLTYGLLKIAYKDQSSKTASEYETLQEEFNKLRAELRRIRKNYQNFMYIMGAEGLSSSGESDIVELSGRGGPGTFESDDPYSTDVSSTDLTTDLPSTIKEAVSLRSDIGEFVENMSTKIAKFAVIPSICPVAVDPGRRYRVTSGFGWRQNPFSGVWENHGGLDIAAPFGTPVLASADGMIAEMGWDGFLGNFILIRHNERFSTLYGHMSRFANGILKGAKVNRGSIIGYVGMTGRSTWHHIHYEVRVDGVRVNPLDYILN